MIEAYIGIGSNMGDRKQYIQDAIKMLEEKADLEVDKVSNLHETLPVGGAPQMKFLNGAIKIKTNLSPRELLKCLHGIEDKLGRVRSRKNGPRVIDLDILKYGDIEINEEDLIIPHPLMKNRKFVQVPLKEIL